MTKYKLLAYSLVPAALGLGIVGANIASAHGFFGGFGADLTPDQIVSRQQTMFQNEAQVLGISVDEVKEAWADGKSLWQIAQEKNISQEQIQTRMKDLALQQLKTHLQTLVDKGVITQAQADRRVQAMQNMQQKNASRMGMMRGHHRGGFGFGLGL